MTAKPPRSFFSGGELRGVIVFAVIMAVGWPVILNYARPKQREPEPPPKLDPRPLQPDKGIEFDRLVDKTPLGARDNAAYKILLERARKTPQSEIAKVARRDVMYTQLWDKPELYRGVPIHLEGTMRKALAHEQVNPELVPGGRVVECWFFTREANQLPLVVMVEDPPPDMVIGSEISERVIIDAYFFRNLRYLAGDAPRAAPLFVGRLRWADANVKTGAKADAGAEAKPFWQSPVVLVGALVVLYVILRFTLTIQKARRPIVARSGLLADSKPSEEISNEDLTNYFASIPDEEDNQGIDPKT